MAAVLGVKAGTANELDAAFDALDKDGDNAISRSEWHDVVVRSSAFF